MTLRTLTRGAHPFNAAELEVANIAFRQRTIGLIKLVCQRPAANPVAIVVLLEDCGVEWLHAVKLENHTAVQQRVTFHRRVHFLRIGLYPSLMSRERIDSASLMSPNGPTCTRNNLSVVALLATNAG